MKTSETQEKVPLEGKMLCIRKAFKNAKKGLHDQLLSPNLALIISLMKSRLASQALLPQIRAQVRNTSMLNKLVQALKSSFVTLNVPKNLINCTKITQVLDRFKISDNAATMLEASFIKACQGDVNDFCLSRSTTYRARIDNRLQISNEIFQEIREAPSQDLALHWNGKLTKDCFGNKHEALSVLVSETSTYRGQAFGSTEVRKSKWKSSSKCKL